VKLQAMETEMSFHHVDIISVLSYYASVNPTKGGSDGKESRHQRTQQSHRQKAQ